MKTEVSPKKISQLVDGEEALIEAIAISKISEVRIRKKYGYRKTNCQR